jgi:hypothetical protein
MGKASEEGQGAPRAVEQLMMMKRCFSFLLNSFIFSNIFIVLGSSLYNFITTFALLFLIL